MMKVDEMTTSVTILEGIHVLQSCYIFSLEDSLSCRETFEAVLLIDDCSRTILLYHASVERICDFLGQCDRGDNTYS